MIVTLCLVLFNQKSKYPKTCISQLYMTMKSNIFHNVRLKKCFKP